MVSPGADLPWVNAEIDTPGDTGQYVSVAIHPGNGNIYISYYDATNQELRLALSGRGASNCGPNGGPSGNWHCMTVDSGADVGKYSSIAVDPNGGLGIAYYDATNGHLKYAYFPNPNLLTHSIYTIDKGIPAVSTTGMHTSLNYNQEGIPFFYRSSFRECF